MLKSKGLVVHNDTAAADFLSNINFYRFKIYLRPYYDIASKTYPRGATFDNGVEIYRFDEEIRKILFSIISKIEIKLRTKLDQTITSYTNLITIEIQPALAIAEA
ncbi:MAG: Abi family protein [Aeromonadaceae bacterium]|nr:Abi family protein [Aeromonadaceae bacterium]